MHRLLALSLAATLSGSLAAQALPPEVEAALARARIPRDAIAVLVTDAQERGTPRLAHRAGVAVNPASVMKLVTTAAALDLLGPGFSWATSVHVDGPVRDGVLAGTLYLRGQGDPKLVAERLWLLLQRVQALGIRQVQGDIVLDRSAFEAVAHDPAAFDGEPFRPYNAAPDALLVNFRALVLTFVPDAAAGVARIAVDLPLAGMQVASTVALAPGACDDWRGGLRATLGDPAQLRFEGAYPLACGERNWPMAYADPATHTARAIAGLWTALGGRLTGQVRDGRVPPSLRPAFTLRSPPLAEVVRDINKYSNNVMARQLFLTLSQQASGTGTLDGSRAAVARWWRDRFGPDDAPVTENGSGLSRSERITPLGLGRLLQAAWASPLMPDLVASLPQVGVDGTLRRSRAPGGSAHLKTGSLRDVVAIAGYVHGASGRRHVLVAIVNHPNAGAARPALDALVDWAARDQ